MTATISCIETVNRVDFGLSARRNQSFVE